MASLLQRKRYVNKDEPLLSEPEKNNYEAYPAETVDADGNELNTNLKSNVESKEHSENLSLYKGLFYTFVSSFFYSLTWVIVKYVNNISPSQLSLVRFAGILAFTLPLVVYSREHPFGPRLRRHLFISMGVVGAISMVMHFIAFRYLPIADASVINCSIPVFVAVLARIFLREPLGFFQAFTIFLTLLGIALIAKLPVIFMNNTHDFATNYYYGVVAAVGSNIFTATAFVLVRKLMDVHQGIIIFNIALVAIIVNGMVNVITGSFKTPACGLEQWLVIFLGIFSFCGQMLLTLALKQEHAGPVSIVRAATDIVLAFIWEICLFKETPDAWSISGAFLVSSCIVLVGLRKWVMSLPKNSSFREKMHFFTI